MIESPLYSLLIDQIDKTADFTEKMALKIAAGILAQRTDEDDSKTDPRIMLTEEEWDWTPEKVENWGGMMQWITPEGFAADYDRLEEYLAADPDTKWQIRRELLDPTEEMEAVSERKTQDLYGQIRDKDLR